MQTHVVQLTKQRLRDFFVKEDGHVAHKNALVAGTVATGAISGLPTQRGEFATAVVEGKIYLIGGTLFEMSGMVRLGCP